MMNSEIKEILKILVQAEDKIHRFFIEMGGKLPHHICCNYDIEYEGKTFCNCGLSDFMYAAQLAKEVLTKD